MSQRNRLLCYVKQITGSTKVGVELPLKLLLSFAKVVLCVLISPLRSVIRYVRLSDNCVYVSKIIEKFPFAFGRFRRQS